METENILQAAEPPRAVVISGTESCGHYWCTPVFALGSTLFHIVINVGGGTQHALGDPFKGTSAGWRNRQTRTSGKASVKSYTWGGIIPCSSTGWGVTSSREGHQADHEPPHTLCVRKSVAKSREVILPLCSALVRHKSSAGSSFGLPSSIWTKDIQEWFQRGATKVIKWLEHLRDKEKLRELGLSSLEKRKLKGDLTNVCKWLIRKS